jgi:hypothetical protein
MLQHFRRRCAEFFRKLVHVGHQPLVVVALGEQHAPDVNVIILKIRKKLANKCAFLLKMQLLMQEKVIIILVYLKIAKCFA